MPDTLEAARMNLAAVARRMRLFLTRRRRPLWRQGTRKAIRQANDALAVQRAQLDDMPFEVIEGWLTMRGWVVVSRDWHRRHAALDALRAARLPANWPPLADDDE